MDKVSVIIPSRNEIFLSQTVDDIFAKATGQIEVIVILEGYWPEPMLSSRDDLIIVHHGQPEGMRQAINAGAAIATGKYLMKSDAHCMFAEGFDEVLKADCESDWVCIPRRYSLDAEKWERRAKAPIDYMYLSYPDDPQDFGGAGYHGRVWSEKNRDEKLKDIKIDDAMSFQGSCWFMERDYFYFLELMNAENWGTFWQEAQEIGPKCWFSGGRVVRNKKTWYAHLHKGKKYGRGYFLDKRTTKRSVVQSTKFMNSNEWPKQKPGRDLRWLVHHFWPLPGWPAEWAPQVGIESGHQMNNTEILHQKFNPRSDQIPPIRVKGFDRVKLAQLFAELGFKRGVEVGVADGRNSLTLCKNIPDLELYCVDPWKKYPGNPRAHDNQDECYRLASERLKPYNATLVTAMSMDAVRDFAGWDCLDFVHIDGNHGFDWFMQDLIEWSKLVRKGGIISGHDYYRFRWAGVVDAVNAYTRAHQVNEWFIDDQRETSFFWAKG